LDQIEQPRPEPPNETQAPAGPPATPAVSPTPSPPASYWLVPTTTGAGSAPAPSRAILAVAWLLAIVVVAFGALISIGTATGSDARRFGYAIGAFAAPFLFALILRAGLVRVMRGRPDAPVGIIRSPWVPLGALLLAGLNLIGNVATFAPPAPVDPATALRVGSGYTLRETDPATQQQLAAEYGASDAFRSPFVIREVVGDDGSISFLFAVDGAIRDADMTEAARGLGEGTGVPARVDTIGGEPVALAIGTEFAMASWIEEPLMVSVLASDEPTLRAVVGSVLATPRP
jgi:hypothetical protein